MRRSRDSWTFLRDVTSRSEDWSQQSTRVFGGAMVALVIYVATTFLAFDTVRWDPNVPLCMGLYVVLGTLLAILVWRTRPDPELKDDDSDRHHRHRSHRSESRQEEPRREEFRQEPIVQPKMPPRPPEYEEVEDGPGADEYRRARAMVHSFIPNFKTDGLYLDTLGASAEKDYLPALMKLGEYALRRGMLVEGYYWYWRAQLTKKVNVAEVLHGIVSDWMNEDCPSEGENVNDLFDEERGSITRAILGITANHNAIEAREFLMASHPELMDGLRPIGQ